MSAFFPLGRGMAFAMGALAAIMIAVLITVLAFVWPKQAPGEATAFVAGLLAVVSLGPIAGGVALALNRPRTAMVLAVSPFLLGLLLLLAGR